MTSLQRPAPAPTPTPERPRRRVGGRGVLALAVILAVAVAAPLIAVLIRAVVGYDGSPSALDALADADNLRVIGNTVLLGVLVVVIATVMAAPLAYLMSWTPMRNKRWIDIAVMVPFMTPPYVAALAWMDFTRVDGLADRWLGTWIGDGVRAVLDTPVGMAAIMACELFTFLYLLLRNRFDAMPASSDEAAEVSGASWGQRLRWVVAPLMTPTFALGALVVFLRACAEFGTPITLGNRIGFPVLVSEIYRNVTIDPLDFPRASAFATVLLGMGITVWGLQQWVARKEVPLGARTGRRVLVRDGRWRLVGYPWIIVVLLLSVVVPFVAVIIGAMTVLRSGPLNLGNLTFDYFTRVLQPGQGLEALENSAVLAAVAATAATLFVLAYVSVMTVARSKAPALPGLRRLVDLLGVAPDTVPTIVLVIGFIFLWNAPWLPVTPYNSVWMIILAYTVIMLPLVLQSIKSSRTSFGEGLLEASAAAGASPWQTTRHIMVPLMAPGIVAGWLLGFLFGLREVVASSLLRPASLELVSPWILSEFDQGHRPEAMAMTVIGVLTSTVVLVVLEWWRRRMQETRAA
ncbi:ABC transporter permease subunit [Gordonia sp. HY442]|uniref:ABC transporter permease n=1 Tax=Gordonia zhenghanii TaxID=2911516 RepID=UPI001F021992|nr:ABC transporter permease subunit [Gordonia zhenghanii]MCF8602131.1 ABC transporter permease subunit [Gordonia zhenghanii]